MEEIKNLKFVRYGGLSAVKQRGYDPNMPTFHAPPARRGIYAFVYPFIEQFLLGSNNFIHHRMEWIRDQDGNRIGEGHPLWPNWDKDTSNKLMTFPYKGKFYLARHVKPKTFEYDGDIWHHLEVKPHEKIHEKGSWVLTEMAIYKRALKKEVGRLKQFKKRTGYGFTMDHFEVFIEDL